MGVRDEILDAGMSLLLDSGFAGLTQLQVTKAEGCKQSRQAYYFPARNEMALAIADLASGIEDVPLFYPTVPGLTGPHQSRMTQESEQEIEAGVHVLFKRLRLFVGEDQGKDRGRF